MSLKNRLLTICVVLALGVVVIAAPDDGASAATSNGWTTTGSVSGTQVARGSSVTVTISVVSSFFFNDTAATEIYTGSTKSFQRFWDGQSFTPNVAGQFTAT